MSSRLLPLVSSQEVAHIDSLQQGAGIFFQRQLEQVESQMLMVKRPELNGLTLFPIVPNLNPGAETYTRRMYEQYGVAEIMADYGSDAPRSDVLAIEDSVNFKPVRASYGYNIQEIRAAMMANVALSQLRADAAMKSILSRLNRVIWRGSPEANLFGVLTHPYVPRYAMANASTAAVDTVAADVAAAFNAVSEDTEGVEKPNRLLMAEKLVNAFSVRYRTNTNLTLLDMIANSCKIPKENIIPVYELNGAGDGGGDAFIVDRKDLLVMAHALSVPFEQFPAEPRNLEWVINCHSRTAGMVSSYPLGMKICSFSNALP